MIDQKQIHRLLKKTENKFIDVNVITDTLHINDEQANHILQYLQTQGYIEKSNVDGCWQHAVRGQLLSKKQFKKEFKVETLQNQLNNFLERVNIVNTSKVYPYYVDCAKIVSEYPIQNNNQGIKIVIVLARKKMSDKAYRKAAEKLRRQYNRPFDNYSQFLAYPHTAIISFLKSGSHAIKIFMGEMEYMNEILGYNLPI